jgi:hypothetical protein
MIFFFSGSSAAPLVSRNSSNIAWEMRSELIEPVLRADGRIAGDTGRFRHPVTRLSGASG